MKLGLKGMKAVLAGASKGIGRFREALGEVRTILEGQGWKLADAFVQRSGRLNTVIDLWELYDFNHFDRALQALTVHPRFPELKAVLKETVKSETVVFAGKAPYMA